MGQLAEGLGLELELELVLVLVPELNREA